MKMKTLGLVLVTILLVFGHFSIHANDNEGKLWPPTQPYKTGYFKTDDTHELFYQLGGNPKGKSVMVLHGGPGGSCSPFDFRFFNPDKFHVLLHDQRGSGESKPFAELKNNTTWDLVEDIEKLRKHFKMGKVILFGGSWGSTLALAYAEKYPQNVNGLVLRGVFTSTKAEIDHFYHGGIAKYYPEVFEKLKSVIPQPDKMNYPAQLLKELKKEDPAIREKYTVAWAGYEIKLASLHMPDEQLTYVLNMYKTKLYAFALFENYYMANLCFFKEGQLLNNAHKLKGIPTYIVQGRYDLICPPTTAYKLYKKIPGSKLIFAEKAGHWTREPTVQENLVKAIKELE